ncbi:MAG: hypothetical protein U1F35_11680 [Steroidobacteraceae bacterium]
MRRDLAIIKIDGRSIHVLEHEEHMERAGAARGPYTGLQGFSKKI